MMKKRYLISIRADDRPGLLHLVTGIINRKLIVIESLTAAKTDVHDVVLISIELEVSERALTPLLYKLENVIEIYAVEAQLLDEVVSIRSACFRLDKAILCSPQGAVLTKYQVQLLSMDVSSILMARSGNDAELRKLYNELEGPYMLGFSQTGIIADSKLIVEDQSSVINRLAA